MLYIILIIYSELLIKLFFVCIRFLHSKKNQFQRSGFGRQSMPEKMFSPTYQRNQYLCSRNSHENHLDFRDSNMNSHIAETQNLYDPDTHQIIREMPVDVGPCECKYSKGI